MSWTEPRLSRKSLCRLQLAPNSCPSFLAPGMPGVAHKGHAGYFSFLFIYFISRQVSWCRPGCPDIISVDLSFWGAVLQCDNPVLIKPRQAPTISI